MSDKDNLKQRNFRMSDEEYEGLKDQAENNGITISDMLRKVVNDAVRDGIKKKTTLLSLSNEERVWHDEIKNNHLFESDMKSCNKGDKIVVNIDLGAIFFRDTYLAKRITNSTEIALTAIENVLVKEYGYKNAVFKISNYDSVIDNFTSISRLNADAVGNLVKFRGIIENQTPILAKEAAYEITCENCRNVMLLTADMLENKDDLRCDNCRAKLDKKSDCKASKLVDFVKYRIEDAETVGSDSNAKIICEAESPLVGGDEYFESGASVMVCGIYTPTKEKPTDTVYKKRLVRVLDIQYTEMCIDLTPSEEDIKLFEEGATDPDLLTKLSSTVSPSVYGFDLERQAVTLQLFAGHDTTQDIRNWIHILFIGEPGIGKSKFAKEVVKVTPISRVVEGNGTSEVGLIGCVSRDDELGNDYVLTAGAMALTDGGLLIVEEIDKIKESARNSIHGPLEDGLAIIDKANIHRPLKTRCSILATGNPKNGYFEEDLPYLEQINLNAPLLSRFDAIFFVKKTDDDAVNKAINEQMFDNMSGIKPQTVIDDQYLKKYVKFAQDRIKNITITREARDIINDFVMPIQKLPSNKRFGSLTKRLTASAVRFAKAHARMRLSDVMEEQDAKMAVEIMRRYVNGVLTDPVTKETSFAPLYKQPVDSEIKVMEQIMTIAHDTADYLKTTYHKDDDTKIEDISLDIMKLKDRYAELHGDIPDHVFDNAIDRLHVDSRIKINGLNLRIVEKNRPSQTLFESNWNADM